MPSPPDADQTNPSLLLLCVPGEHAARALLDIAHSTFNGELDIRILWVDREADEFTAPVDPPPWLRSLAEEWGGNIRLAVRNGHVADAVHEMASWLQPEMILLAASANDLEEPRLRGLVVTPPRPLLVLKTGDTPFRPAKILVGANTFGDAGVARDLLYEYIDDPGVHVTFVTVTRQDASDEELDRQVAALRKRVEERAPRCQFDVVARRNREVESGVIDALGEDAFDLVIVDMPREGLVASLSQRTLPARLLQRPVPLLLFNKPLAGAGRHFMAAWNRFYRVIPSLTERDRVGIYSGVRRNSRGDTDFYTMLSLSVAIASLGLLLDSTAVVIGAMIVAPLMQPIVGLGLGIAIGNQRLTSLAFRTAVVGAIAAVILSAVIGFVIPGAGITDELDGRGQPTLIDLLIALASGAAGAYATCRKDVATSVAGVAIAVALVPPLATIGIGLAIGEYPLAIGATLLFLTNFAAISASSVVIFLWLGFKPEASRFGRRESFFRGVGALSVVIATVAVSVWGWDRAGDARFERQVESAVLNAVQGVEPEAEVLDVRIDNAGDVLAVTASVDTLDPGSIRANTPLIQSELSRQLDRPVALIVLARTLRQDDDGED